MESVAFVGLGGMGTRMATRLADAGHRLVVWNRTRDKTRPLVGRGAEAAATPQAAAAAADVVITMLADPAALAEVTERDDGVVAGLRDGATVIEMSTVGPPAIERLAAALPQTVGLLDAPVLGSHNEAETGQLQVFVGGPDDVVERWTPLLSTLGSPMHVGPLGAGAAAKLVANSTLFGVLGLLGEALALARAQGLADDVTFAVLSGTPLAAQAERRRGALRTGDFPLHFALALARKDADLVRAAAAANDVDMRVAAAARSWFADAADAGWGDRDYSAVLEFIRSGGR